MNKIKEIGISIIIPNAIGFIGSLIGNVKEGFQSVIKPVFSPPGFVFPIAWTILYTLMGISSYIVYKSNDIGKKEALTLYGAQLLINASWTFFFFNLKWYLFSFFLILLILVLAIIMTEKFYLINKKAGLLQIPYLLWLIFAAVLNYSIYSLNYIEKVKVIPKMSSNNTIIKLIAFTKIKQGFKKLEEQIKKDLSLKIPEYMIPSIKIIEDFPLNHNGKIDVKKLKEIVNGRESN